jgi:hypothetical protein
MYIGDRKERERYMDDLERQMEDQREQIQRTLERTEGSGRRGGALERLRGSLPRFPGRAPAQGDPEETPEERREKVPQSSDLPGPNRTPTEDTGEQETVPERPWWRRWLG